jgi:hypothetical protein
VTKVIAAKFEVSNVFGIADNIMFQLIGDELK